tara:strand:+ start:582 stop:908 length:327 start_codon:yes stop_codon:yes gene_type:complete
MSKKPYFPNNWKQIKNAPSSMFESISYDEFMEWKVAGWELPGSVSCIIRDENFKTGKIKEYIYQSDTAANNKISSLMKQGESLIAVCCVDTIHHMTPKEEEDDEFEDA